MTSPRQRKQKVGYEHVRWTEGLFSFHRCFRPARPITVSAEVSSREPVCVSIIETVHTDKTVTTEFLGAEHLIDGARSVWEQREARCFASGTRTPNWSTRRIQKTAKTVWQVLFDATEAVPTRFHSTRQGFKPTVSTFKWRNALWLHYKVLHDKATKATQRDKGLRELARLFVAQYEARNDKELAPEVRREVEALFQERVAAGSPDSDRAASQSPGGLGLSIVAAIVGAASGRELRKVVEASLGEGYELPHGDPRVDSRSPTAKRPSSQAGAAVRAATRLHQSRVKR